MVNSTVFVGPQPLSFTGDRGCGSHLAFFRSFWCSRVNLCVLNFTHLLLCFFLRSDHFALALVVLHQHLGRSGRRSCLFCGGENGSSEDEKPPEAESLLADNPLTFVIYC